MSISNAHELFVHKLGTIYDAEHQFVDGQQEEQTAWIAEQSAPNCCRRPCKHLQVHHRVRGRSR